MIDAFIIQEGYSSRAMCLICMGPDVETLSTEEIKTFRTLALETYLKEMGTAIRNKDSIEIIDEYTIKIYIPEYGELVFDTRKIVHQGKIRDGEIGKSFSRQDFKKLIEFLGGTIEKGIMQAGASVAAFFCDVIGLESNTFYWARDWEDYYFAWGIMVSAEKVELKSVYQTEVHGTILR